jgi:hypothetical protein
MIKRCATDDSATYMEGRIEGEQHVVHRAKRCNNSAVARSGSMAFTKVYWESAYLLSTPSEDVYGVHIFYLERAL